MESTRTLLEQSRAVAFAGQPVPVACERLSVDADVAAHTHDYLELAVVLAGRSTYVTRERRRSIGAGDVVIVRPGSWHAFESCRELEVYNVYVGPELLQHQLAWVLDHPDLARALLHGGESTRPLSTAAVRRVDEWLAQMPRRPGPGTTEDPGPDSTILLLGLLGCVLSEVAHADVAGRTRSVVVTRPVREAIAAMSGDLARPWSVGEVASEVGLSTSQLHRQFAAQVGLTPMQWLTRTRAERAASLLAGTTATVAQIGRTVGWPDPNYASRRFGSVYGLTPSAYRARFAFASSSDSPVTRSRPKAEHEYRDVVRQRRTRGG